MTTRPKPPYSVPSMAEIEAIPWNGYKVVSTFSGAGGSCLGYRMAGYKVVWANEFVKAAAETYRANHPQTILDTRDIRTVKPEDILRATGLEVGGIDLFDGSPPCAAFSTVGIREKGWGKVKAYSDTEQRVDDLFFEYIRLLRGLQPKVFVAENVAGLVKGKAKGYFVEILTLLRDCGYNVQARVLDAQWLGVPQTRNRIIFIGVRNDLGLAPVFPRPLAYRYSIREAIPWITEQNERVIHDTRGQPQFSAGDVTDRPAPAVIAQGHHFEVVRQVEPESDISRFAIGREWDKVKPGGKSEKYFSLVKPELDKPCPAVTAIVGHSTSVAGVVHPLEKRRFSIHELKRICAFPDDFKLTGSYMQQWERLGRAVPPVMMMHIASAIASGVLDKVGQRS